MSDAYYQERARRRTRRLILAAALLAAVACPVVGVLSLFYDACTGGFDRSPRAVVEVYAAALAQGETLQAQECWEHEAYYDLGAGCSEICISRFSGAGFGVVEINVGQPYATPAGRSNLPVTVTIACAGGGPTHSAEIVLDSVGADLPWRHWAIIHSTLGGTTAEAWCR
jgi:hypothetical protein